MRRRTFKSRAKIADLPAEVVSLIAYYLPVTDFTNFRWTCKHFYCVSHCKMVMDNYKICPTTYDLSILKFIDNVHGGKYVNLVLPNFENDQVKKILKHGYNLSSLSMPINQLFKGMETLCPHLHHLYLDTTMQLKYTGQRKLHYFFQALSELPNLKTLALFGIARNDDNSNLLRFQLSSEVIIAILQKTKQIETFKLKNLFVKIENTSRFQECLLACSHVKNWSFFHVTTSWIDFKIPSSVKVLNCQFTNFIPIDPSVHTELEKIIIITKQKVQPDNGVLQVLSQQQNPDWNLYAKIRNGIISVESVGVAFLKVQLFNMPYCTISSFLDNTIDVVAIAISQLYINEKKSDRYLPFSGYCSTDLNNQKLTCLLNKLKNLKRLVLSYIDGITADFLSNVQFNNQIWISFIKCKQITQDVINEKQDIDYDTSTTTISVVE